MTSRCPCLELPSLTHTKLPCVPAPLGGSSRQLGMGSERAWCAQRLQPVAEPGASSLPLSPQSCCCPPPQPAV